jgi:hypothetical protein
MASPYDPWRNTYGMPGPQDLNRPGEIRASTAPRWEELLRGSDVTAINRNPLVQALQRYTNRAPSGIGEVTRVSPIDGRPVPPEPTALDNLPPTVQEGIGGLGLLANFLAPGVKLPRPTFAPPDLTQTGWVFKSVGKPHGLMQKGEWKAYNNAVDNQSWLDVELPIRSMTATQSKVNPDFMNPVHSGEPQLPPMVMKKDGQYFVQDGHHRLTKAAAEGRQTAPVRLIDLDGTTQTDFPLLDAISKAAPKPQGIRAYHGSPADFDRFDSRFINTGEKAQAYGHGLYFAESEGVANNYRMALGKRQDVKYGGVTPSDNATVILKRNEYDVERALADLAEARKTAEGWRDTRMMQTIDRDMAELQGLRGKPVELPGRMYEVSINADPERFLDWDLQHNEQSAFVNDALAKARAQGRFPQAPRRYIPRTPEETAALREAGIPGIRYKDAMSRGADGGTSNYVVFDDSLIQILRKYGLLPPAAAAGASMLEQQEPPL